MFDFAKVKIFDKLSQFLERTSKIRIYGNYVRGDKDSGGYI